MSRITLAPGSPLAVYQQALKDQEQATNAVSTSFGTSLFIEPGTYGKIEVQQANGDGGRDSIKLNPTEIEWVASQLARLIGKVVVDPSEVKQPEGLEIPF